MYFTSTPDLNSMEAIMKRPPGRNQRGGGRLRRVYPFSKADCDCRLCLYHRKKKGCSMEICPVLDVRLTCGAASLYEAVHAAFADARHIPFQRRLSHLYNRKDDAPMIFQTDQHNQRFEAQKLYLRKPDHRSLTLQCKGTFKGLFTFGLVGLICAVMAFVFSYNAPDTAPSVSTVLGFVFYNLAIAISEEFLFRGAVFTQMLDSWKERKGFIRAAIIGSSVIFGLRHFLNLVTAPNVIISTVGQVLFTFMAGFYLCAVYLRTRNIWVCVIIHFLEDFFTGFWAVVSTSAAAAQAIDGTAANMFLLVGVHLVYIIFGVLMLKDKKWKYVPCLQDWASMKMHLYLPANTTKTAR